MVSNEYKALFVWYCKDQGQSTAGVPGDCIGYLPERPVDSRRRKGSQGQLRS